MRLNHARICERYDAKAIVFAHHQRRRCRVNQTTFSSTIVLKNKNPPPIKHWPASVAVDEKKNIYYYDNPETPGARENGDKKNYTFSSYNTPDNMLLYFIRSIKNKKKKKPFSSTSEKAYRLTAPSCGRPVVDCKIRVRTIINSRRNRRLKNARRFFNI